MYSDPINLTDGPSDNDLQAWQSKLDKILDSLQSGKLKPEDLDKDLFNLSLNDLKKGFNNGFQISKDISYTDPDYNFRTAVNKNLYKFAGAKSYQELRDLSGMLMGTDGKVVDFKTFRENIEDYRANALGIDELYNKNWLYTEYTGAVNSGLAAKRWKEFEDTADLFPNLEYRTAGDSHVRVSHQELNGIIKPINDPFWDEYYPPNDWGCRCRARPTNEGPTQQAQKIDIPDMFRNNVGKTGEVFSQDHPYFNSGDIGSSNTFATVRKFEAMDWYDSQLPKYKQLNAKFETISAINELGGSIHQEGGFLPDASYLEIARKLSSLGDSVVLLRQDEAQATALVQAIKSNFAKVASAADISSTISDGLSVAGTFTIELGSSVKRAAVISALSGYTKDPRLKSAILLRAGKKCVLTSRDIVTGNYAPLKEIGL